MEIKQFFIDVCYFELILSNNFHLYLMIIKAINQIQVRNNNRNTRTKIRLFSSLAMKYISQKCLKNICKCRWFITNRNTKHEWNEHRFSHCWWNTICLKNTSHSFEISLDKIVCVHGHACLHNTWCTEFKSMFTTDVIVAIAACDLYLWVFWGSHTLQCFHLLALVAI